jgi:hypothetical protein
MKSSISREDNIAFGYSTLFCSITGHYNARGRSLGSATRNALTSQRAHVSKNFALPHRNNLKYRPVSPHIQYPAPSMLQTPNFFPLHVLSCQQTSHREYLSCTTVHGDAQAHIKAVCFCRWLPSPPITVEIECYTSTDSTVAWWETS